VEQAVKAMTKNSDKIIDGHFHCSTLDIVLVEAVEALIKEIILDKKSKMCAP
jgi:hypothetical protein